MRWRISYSPAAADCSTLGMRLTACPTLNLCITMLSILISDCYISLASAEREQIASESPARLVLIMIDDNQLELRGPWHTHLRTLSILPLLEVNRRARLSVRNVLNGRTQLFFPLHQGKQPW